MMTEQDTDLRGALNAAYPMAEPPDALRQRVAVLADTSAPLKVIQRQRRRRSRLRFLGVGATSLLILTLLLLPRLSAVLALAHMADSLRDVRSVHLTNWQVLPGGKRVKGAEQWYQAGNWRVEDADGHRIQVCAGGSRWTYAKGENTVTLERAAFPIGYQGVSGFSVAAGTRDAIAMGVLMDVRMFGPTTINGHPAHWIRVSDNKYPDARSEIAVDDATDLPLRQEGEERVKGQWVLRSVGVSEYDTPLAASLFTPNFPKTARLVDVEAGRDIWRQRLAKGVAAQARGHSTVVISYDKINGEVRPRERLVRGPRRVAVRDFQTNALGDVFLLFTNGSGAGGSDTLRAAELTDEYGTQYIAPAAQQDGHLGEGHMQFIATCLDQGKRNPAATVVNGYLFNNEQLIGYWWVPLQPRRLGKPHHFTLTLHQNFEDGKVVFQLPIEKPACTVVPEYMPYMARPLFDEWVITHEEALTRADHYRPYDLPQALFWYQRAIAIDQGEDRRSGGHIAEEDEWFAIYKIQTQLGRTREAKPALLSADKDAVYASSKRDEIRAEMKKLGLNP